MALWDRDYKRNPFTKQIKKIQGKNIATLLNSENGGWWVEVPRVQAALDVSRNFPPGPNCLKAN